MPKMHTIRRDVTPHIHVVYKVRCMSRAVAESMFLKSAAMRAAIEFTRGAR